MSMTIQRPLVLVVDDEPLIAGLLAAALDDAGFVALQASNADEAFAYLDDASVTVVGVITDINLGCEKDGWDVGRHARGQNAAVAVVYCSGASAHQWSQRGVPKSNMLLKPFAEAQVVIAMVDQINAACPPAGQL